MSKPNIIKRHYVEHHPNYNSGMVEVITDKGSLRITFNPDGSFRLITDLPVKQAGEIVKEKFGEFQHVQVVERFGHPFED